MESNYRILSGLLGGKGFCPPTVWTASVEKNDGEKMSNQALETVDEQHPAKVSRWFHPVRGSSSITNNVVQPWTDELVLVS